MALGRRPPLDRVKKGRRESKHLDFKTEFDTSSNAAWCELIKDFAAIANSGGGVVGIGQRNDGVPSGADVSAVLKLDVAQITDKLFKYTGENHSGFEIHEVVREGKKIAAVVIEAVETPIVFTKPGTYEVTPTQQHTAFSKGTIYFRHGAKSEPATAHDLRDFIDRRVEAIRQAWLGNIRSVVDAPPDAQVAVYHPTAENEAGEPTKIKLTTDPAAPTYGMLDPDKTHPHRQTELLREVNKRLPAKAAINSYDAQCVRRVHNIDATTKPEFCYLPKFGSIQYSDTFVTWLVERHTADKEFFGKARIRFYELQHGG